jgi:DHA1 family bicyclomycin/chloramphenicol resistance-like MFS transporter
VQHSNRVGPPSLGLLAAITALAFCALHMVVPALPLLVGLFDDSPSRVQLVLSVYLAGIAAGQLVYGPLSDCFGRRPVLIAGLAMFLFGTVMCGAAPSLDWLILGRVFEGLGACAGIVLARAIIRDVYEREAAARGLALVMMAMTLGPGDLAGFRRIPVGMDQLARDLRAADGERCGDHDVANYVARIRAARQTF